MRWLAMFVLLPLLLWFGPCAAAAPGETAVPFAGKRVALLIGNSNYASAPTLINPRNDVQAMKSMLADIGFEVEVATDLSSRDTLKILRRFEDKAAGADIGIIYYSGHGVEADGQNYLIPVDANLRSSSDLQDEAISLERVIHAADAVRRLKVIILDACRDNPFGELKARTRSSGSGRGLARIDPAGADTLIAYSAKAGTTALDAARSDTSLSPFTSALVKYLALPGLDVRISLGKVRDAVVAETGGKQEPFVYGSLGGNVVSLVPADEGRATGNAEAANEGCTVAAEHWREADKLNLRSHFEDHVRLFPACPFVNMARARIALLDGRTSQPVQDHDVATRTVSAVYKKVMDVGFQIVVGTDDHHLIASLAFMPDGKSFVSGGWDKIARLWNVGRAAEIRSFRGHDGGINAVAVSSTGRVIATGSWDRTARLWDVETGASLKVLAGHKDGVTAVAFSPDGTRLATGSWDNTIKIWAVASGEAIQTLPPHGYVVKALAFSADGTRLLSGSGDTTVRLWDLATGTQISAFWQHSGWVNSVVFSPDGRFILSASDDKSARIIDASSFQELRRVDVGSEAKSAAFAPDGRSFAVATWDKNVRVFDSQTGRMIRELNVAEIRSTPVVPTWAAPVVFSPDGRYLIAAAPPAIRIWNAKGGALERIIVALSDTGTLALNGDANIQSIAGDRDLLFRLARHGALRLPSAVEREVLGAIGTAQLLESSGTSVAAP